MLLSSKASQALLRKFLVYLYLLIIPGVSINSIYTPELISVWIPLISSQVVFDLLDTAAIGYPTKLLSSDDFPEFGGPTIEAHKNLYSGCVLAIFSL